MPSIPLIAAAVLLVVGFNLFAIALCRAAALGDAVLDHGRNRPVASTNICLPVNGLVRPSWTIASSARASPIR